MTLIENLDGINYVDTEGNVRHVSDFTDGDMDQIPASTFLANKIMAAELRRAKLDVKGVSVDLGSRATSLALAGDYISKMHKARGFRSAIDLGEGGGPVARYGRYKAEEMSDRLSDSADAARFRLDDAAEYLAATDELLAVGFSRDELVDTGATESDIKKSILESFGTKASERNKKISAANQAAGLEPIKKKRMNKK